MKNFFTYAIVFIAGYGIGYFTWVVQDFFREEEINDIIR